MKPRWVYITLLGNLCSGFPTRSDTVYSQKMSGELNLGSTVAEAASVGQNTANMHLCFCIRRSRCSIVSDPKIAGIVVMTSLNNRCCF